MSLDQSTRDSLRIERHVIAPREAGVSAKTAGKIAGRGRSAGRQQRRRRDQRDAAPELTEGAAVAAAEE